MKSLYLSSALLLTFIGGVVFSLPSFAASDQAPTAQLSQRPTQLELEQAILKVRSIGDYEHHFPTSSSPALSRDVKFYQEYNYLRALVTAARNLLADFDTTPTDDLLAIIAAAKDAEIACNLKFGITHQKFVAAQAQTTQVAAPQADTTSPLTPDTQATAPSPASTASKSSTATTKPKAVQTTFQPASSQAASSNVIDASVEAILPSHESAPVPAVPETTNSQSIESTNQESPSVQLLAHGSTATVATCFIGAVIYNERRTYRPGRSRK